MWQANFLSRRVASAAVGWERAVSASLVQRRLTTPGDSVLASLVDQRLTTPGDAVLASLVNPKLTSFRTES